jgi:uncharacterized protein YecE (DUF72 family)
VARLAEIRLGTSSFTAPGWNGPFYPRELKSADRLAFYAEHFDTVEIDSTFYACPSPQTVNGWHSKTPGEFIFSVKVPQTITHEKLLVGCDTDLKQFVDILGGLGDKLGPMIFQFPFFDRAAFKTQSDFLSRLVPFLKRLPQGFKFAVEIRNKEWLDPEFVAVLRDFSVALVLQDESRMPAVRKLNFDPITTDWTYIRWLGDRKGIEKITNAWNKTVIDRTNEISAWVDVCYETVRRGVAVFGYANNHYAGYAPATIRQFRDLWDAKHLPELRKPRAKAKAAMLFDI